MALVAAAVFVPSLGSGFVYDSRMQVVTDTFLHDPGNWFDVLSGRVLGRDVLDNNRPVQLASLMIDAAIWGREPIGYHLTNLVLHTLDAVLVCLVVHRILAQPSRGAADAGEPLPEPVRALLACGAGALFAVHPLMVEAVAEPSFREDLLATLFTLLAIRLAAGLPSPDAGDPPAAGRAVAVVASCLLAIGSKESGIAASLLVGVWWWLFARCRRGDWVLAIGGSLAVSAAFLAARFLLAPASEIFSSPPVRLGGSLAETVSIQARILALYGRLTLVPWPLSAEYGPWSLQSLPLVLAGPLVIGALLGGTAWGWHDRRAAFGMSMVVAALLPVCNLIPIYKPVADRYMYMPMAGVAALAATAAAGGWRRTGTTTRRRALAGGLAVLAALATASVWRQQVWRSSLSLWESTARGNPQSPLAALGLAESLLEAGRAAAARDAAIASIRLSREGWADPWVALALALDRLGDGPQAQHALGRALALDGRLADPDACVARLAMHRPQAVALSALLARRPQAPSPAATTPSASTGLPAPVASPEPSPTALTPTTE